MLFVVLSLMLGALTGSALAVRVLGGAARWPLFVFLGAFLPLLTYPDLQAEMLTAFCFGFVAALHFIILFFRGQDGWRPGGGDDPEPPAYPWWPGFERDLERYSQEPTKPSTREPSLH